VNIDTTLAQDAAAPASIFLRSIAGFACQTWIALLALVSFPFYIRLLGMEAFGLIGFYYTLQALLRVLDLGLTPSVIRELARSASPGNEASTLSEKAGTFETLFIAIATLISLAIVALSPIIAHHWLRNESLSTGDVTVCLSMMGLQCGVNWLSSFYQSALLGMERQVRLYILRSVEATFSSLGALALIIYTKAGIQLFFTWQLAIAGCLLICYRIAFTRSLPAPPHLFTFRFSYLYKIRRFAAGMSIITLLGLILTNMDRVFLSHYVSLDKFGIYSLASYAVSTLFGVFVPPMFNVMYPRFSSLIATDERSLHKIYHLTIQWFAVITGPLLVGVLLFTHDFLMVWTQSSDVANVATRPIAWLAVGWSLNTLMMSSYILQIASGWTSIGVKLSTLLVSLFAPTLVILTIYFGIEGAAVNYALMNSAYLALGLGWTHRRLLRGQLNTVIIVDIFPMVLVCALILAIMRTNPLGSLNTWARLTAGAGVVSATFVLSALATNSPRAEILKTLKLNASMTKEHICQATSLVKDRSQP